MTIVKGKTVCTNCDNEHPVEIDLDDITIDKLKTSKITDATVEQTQAPPPETTEIKTKTVFKVPSHIPSASCKNGKCGKNHKNDNYTNAPNQKCENCGQLSFNTKNCPWCNKDEFEEIDKETLEELGIPIPEIHEEHDHNHDEE